MTARKAPAEAAPAGPASASGRAGGAAGKAAGASVSGRERPAWTAEAAFDLLYVRSAGPLRRQIELLTGDPGFARHAVAHAFDLAWQRWPEVARDSDPVGWVRAVAHAFALAPWHRWTPGPRPRPRTPQDPLEAALLDLPPVRRRAVLLHDGLGLPLPQTAAEVEAGTLSAAGRVALAREALTEAVPELADGVPARLSALLEPAAEPPDAPGDAPGDIRDASERGVRRRTVGAFALTGLIAVLTTLAVALGPAHGIHPHDPGPDVPPAAKPVRDR
ncbi:hypothetical protein OG552_22420 [Streptomyces sp. NBC_01476]|uniref:hypothetical protein n=1 Tax=Streptomyces sp. NBC_01476 TaxID=2903881 RepID=UPI002E30CE8B|nr:hypothetical protein [Streptomyces sp. NBC_01476]